MPGGDPSQGVFAGMQFVEIAARIGKIGCGLIIGDGRIPGVAMMSEVIRHLCGIPELVLDFPLKRLDSGFKPGTRRKGLRGRGLWVRAHGYSRIEGTGGCDRTRAIFGVFRGLALTRLIAALAIRKTVV